jgi:diguanylate cyclase (GGDEF)-like protein
MLQVDVISAYVICGAGSLVGAAMMQLARPDEPRLRQALGSFVWAFLVLGSGLAQLVMWEKDPPPYAMLVALESTVLGLALFGVGFARLNARPVPRVTPVVVGLALLVLGAAEREGGRVYAITFVLTSTAFACVMAFVLRHAVRRPRNLAERVVGLSLILHASSWIVRAGFTVMHDGPPLAHHLYAPGGLVTVFGIFYCVMPIIIAALVLNVVNARLSQQLRSRALTDELTGVLTRRALRELAPALVANAASNGQQVAVLMLDLDHFKAVNDRHGHQAGDQVLRRAAEVIGINLRPEAMLTRFGGEEFVVIAPVPDMRTARLIAERLRGAVAAEAFPTDAAAIPVTTSIGVALLAADETLEPALARADEALYRAKRDGRNRVETSIAAAPTGSAASTRRKPIVERGAATSSSFPDSVPRSS